MENKALTRYFRIMKLRDSGVHVSWCTRCEKELLWVYFYPLIEGLCQNCRSKK